MSDEKTDRKVEPKMVRESDLLAQKAKVEKLQKEMAELRAENTQLQSELKVAKMTEVDDEDVIAVRKLLLEQETELNKKIAELDKRQEEIDEKETSFKEREKESRVKALASEYGVDEEELKKADDPEKRAYELALKRITKEKKESPAENVFEGGQAGGIIKKSPLDMTPEELKVFEKEHSIKK